MYSYPGSNNVNRYYVNPGIPVGRPLSYKNIQPPFPAPGMSSHISTPNVVPMYPQMYPGAMYPAYRPPGPGYHPPEPEYHPPGPGYAPMFPGMSPSMSPQVSPPLSPLIPSPMPPMNNLMGPVITPLECPSVAFSTIMGESMRRLPRNVPPNYLPPTVLISTRRQTSTPAKITPREFKEDDALSQEEADWSCQKMGFNFLLKSLLELAGLVKDAIKINHYNAWISADVGWFIENDLDFGMAYASIRFAWKPLLFPDPIDLAQFRSYVWRQYNSWMKFRSDVMQYDQETGQDLIHEPYGLKPSRIWDLKGNRVIDYIMIFSSYLTSYLARGNIPNRDIYAPFWAITHSWTKESDSVVYNTSINSYQWPVRFPAEVTIEKVRTELLGFHGQGSDYVWLDVMCLRQEAGPKYASIKAQEWKLDVPIIGNIYLLATCLVRYLNGLGREMSTEGWDDERHWLQRAWTLQEIRAPEVTHTGGVPPDIVNPMNVVGKINGQTITLRNALAPILELGKAVASPGGCSVYSLAREMGRRHATNETDKVAGLHYLLGTRRLPAYSAAVKAEEAWVRCFHELLFRPRIEILFDYPYRAKTGTSWFPGWTELVNWPDRKSELKHSRPVWDAPDAFYMAPATDANPSHLYIPQVALIPNVTLEAACGDGEYRAKPSGRNRWLGFFAPYAGQDRIPNGQYTLATLKISEECNWVVCHPVGQVMLHTAWGARAFPAMTVKLAKVGVLRTDAVSDIKSENAITHSPCLFK